MVIGSAAPTCSFNLVELAGVHECLAVKVPKHDPDRIWSGEVGVLTVTSHRATVLLLMTLPPAPIDVMAFFGTQGSPSLCKDRVSCGYRTRWWP